VLLSLDSSLSVFYVSLLVKLKGVTLDHIGPVLVTFHEIISEYVLANPLDMFLDWTSVTISWKAKKRGGSLL
jgi:hypothetical protein